MRILSRRSDPSRTLVLAAVTLIATAQTAHAQGAPAGQRERPAMFACPWAPPDPARTAPTPASPTGVVDPPRTRIPDCAPPAWKPPAQLKPHQPAPLPA